MAGQDDSGGGIGEWFSNAWDKVKTTLSLDKAWDTVEAKAAAAQGLLFGGVLDRAVQNALKNLWSVTFKPIIDNVKSGADENIATIVDAFVRDNAIPQDLADTVKRVFKGHPISGQVASALIPLLYTVLILVGWLGQLGNKAGQEASRQIRGNVPDASSVMRAAFIDNATIDRVKEIMARQGYMDQDIELLFKAQYATYDMTTVRDLFLRGAIDQDTMFARMREMGFTDTRIKEIVKTWDLIPPVTDIIRMAVREAFSDAQVASLGLDEAFPDAVKVWGEKQGLSEFWQRQYWRAHWELPSAQMGFEMLHRGLIDETTLRGLIKALDYSPTWHDKLINISYNVMTRVDVRRIYELGLIDDAGLLAQYKAMGYSPSDADLLVKWTQIEYNQEYKDITAQEVIKQYLVGITSIDQAREMLGRLGYTAGRIDTMIALASYQRGFANQTARIEALHKLYLTGQIGASEVTAELQVFNVDERRINELLDLWALEYRAGLKLPRFQELTAWLQNGIIDANTFRTEMLRNGYSKEHIEMYVAAAGYAADLTREKNKAQKAASGEITADITRSDLDGFYTDGIITSQQYHDELIKRGYSETDVSRLVIENAPKETIKAVKLPSRGDLDSWYIEGIIGEAEYRAGLAELNYRTDDIARIVAASNKRKEAKK